MNIKLCEDCRNFVQCNYNSDLGIIESGPNDERSVATIWRAIETGCRLCKAVVYKFELIKPGLLLSAKASNQRVAFNSLIRSYGNSTMDSPEDWDRKFLKVSVLEIEAEFRIWRVTEGFIAEDLSWVDHNTGAEPSFARAADWLHACILEHDSCIQVNTPRNWVPHRLLDAGSGCPFPDMIELKHTEGWQTPVRYAALSHCWGDIQPLRLLQSNLQTFLRGIPFAELPKTFQDAIHTIRRLRIRYLWIDSLCIIQDSKKDWDIESSLMAFVYGGSMINIAAAASDNCAGGIFRDRPSSFIGSCLLPVSCRNETSTIWYQLHDQDLWNTEFDTTKLNTRAWVMQERMLSPRTLAYTKTQLFWECRAKRACEEFPSGYPVEYFEKPPTLFGLPSLESQLKTQSLLGKDDHRIGRSSISQLSLAWHNLVMLYSSRNITFEQDKLVAIGGLATLFGQQMGGIYLAGLWRSTLLNDLLWEVDAYKYPRRRSLTYRAPSWSWASMQCPITFVPGRVESEKVTVIDVKIQTMVKSLQWGKVKGGYLRLQGKLFPNLCAVPNGNSKKFSLITRSINYTSPIAHCVPDERETQEEDLTLIEEELLCLPLVSYVNASQAIGHLCEFRGLVLTPKNGQPRGHYQRWGIFEVRHSQFFEDSHNEAASECYVEGKDSTFIIL
ncbi:hypothetical protein PG987_004268 [Apiospora arundinis]